MNRCIQLSDDVETLISSDMMISKMSHDLELDIGFFSSAFHLFMVAGLLLNVVRTALLSSALREGTRLVQTMMSRVHVPNVCVCTSLSPEKLHIISCEW